MRRFAPLLLPSLLLTLHAACKRSPSVAAVREGYVDAGGGVRLFYQTNGSGRDTIVVIHGGPGLSMEYIVNDMESLAARHTLVFYDQRGSGRSTLVSDSAGLDAQRFADDLEAVRRHFGIERLVPLGHSWGAGVIALYAARYPEHLGPLLLVGPMPLTGQELGQAFAQLQAGRDSAMLRQMQQLSETRRADPADTTACRAYYRLWFTPFFADTTMLDRIRGNFCGGSPEALRNKPNVDKFTWASLGNWDWRPSLRGVTARTLVISGTKDPLLVATARSWAVTMPEARLLVLDNVGHFPYVEVPDRFGAALDAFLAGGWPEGAERTTTP